MSISTIKINKKRMLEITLFVIVMLLSFYMVFHGQDVSVILQSIKKLSLLSLLAAVATAIFFVSAEGIMIYYLLHSLNGKSGLMRCISYSFIGFFYSGITPSATGGQPMQLYYMKKDGNRLADSSVVLMVVALIYKFVLVIFGIGMLLFWYRPLKFYLQNYFWVYLLGLALNIILVVVLSGVMVVPDIMKKILLWAETLLEKIKVLKASSKGEKRSYEFVDNYQSAVSFLKGNKQKILVVIGMTFLQRCSVFFLTYIIYCGFGLKGADVVTVMLLQASVYIAVDMLPVPGAQGITEMMYQKVFQMIFPAVYLMPSLYVTRGINFYFLLILSICIVVGNSIYRLRTVKK